MPGIKIENYRDINVDLEFDPLPNAFVSVPVYTTKPYMIDWDLTLNGCPYAINTQEDNRHEVATYEDYKWISDSAKVPLG